MWLLIQSFIVYTLFALLLFCAARAVSYEQAFDMQNSNHWYSLPRGYWICVLIFAVVSGLRWNVGIDHLQYVSFYETMAKGSDIYRETIEPGFMFVYRTFAESGLHFFFFFAFVAFVQMFFIISTFREHHEIVTYIVVLLILGSYYLYLSNGLRQCLVACSFVWLCQFIKDRNWKVLVVWLIVAFTFHRSAVLLVPFFAFTFLNKEWTNSKIMLLILVSCIIVGETPVWTNSMTSFGELVGFMGYDTYSEQFTDMISGENFRVQNWGPSKISILALNIFVIINYEGVRNYFYSDKSLDLFQKFSYIGACAYYLFTNTSHIFLRPIEYFTFFLLPMSAYTLCYLKNNYKNISLLVMSIMAFSYIYIACYKAYVDTEGLGHSSTLFQFFFSNELYGR